MTKITIRIDEVLLARGRECARKRGTTFNQLVRDLLEREILASQLEALYSMFENAKRLEIRSYDGYLSREEANERA
jgi:hypothetical protein